MRQSSAPSISTGANRLDQASDCDFCSHALLSFANFLQGYPVGPGSNGFLQAGGFDKDQVLDRRNAEAPADFVRGTSDPHLAETSTISTLVIFEENFAFTQII